MSTERTLSIIKPDATKRNINGAILKVIEERGLKIIAQKRCIITKEEAAEFYAIHKERHFFNDLVEYMTSGPITVQVLEGEDAVNSYRDVMGATNPAEAAENTIRALYGIDIQHNTVHGSDSLENAQKEISFFFSDHTITG